MQWQKELKQPALVVADVTNIDLIFKSYGTPFTQNKALNGMLTPLYGL
jgi:hypothetical protein